MFTHRTTRVYFTRLSAVASSRRRTALALFVALTVSTPAFAQGLVESATGNAMRPAFSGRDVPASRGRFTFPSPYNTEGARITEAGDCGGSDCVQPVGYAYWSNINNHVGSDTMLIFLGLKGQGPTLFSYNKKTGNTQKRGALFEGDSTFGWARLSSGEGWYFSGTRPNALYINEPTGGRLFRYDVIAHTWETVFDISGQFSGKYLWQVHSSNDDRVHSFTVRDKGSYAMEGCAIYREDQRKFVYFARKGNDFDECQIDKSGKWLLIKEDLNGDGGEDNRVVDVESNSERILMNADGAAGHSDIGYGYMVAEDNFNNQPGAVRVWDFSKDLRGGQPASPVAGQGTLVYQISRWMSLAQHIAHGNSKPGIPLDQQVACASNGSAETAARNNEIVCFRLNDSLNALIVAPTLTDVNAPGSGGNSGDTYWKFPKGNLDITGEYFIWTSNGGTNRLDAFIVKVPLDRLGGSPSGSSPPSDPTAGNDPAPAPTPSPAPSPAPESGPTPAPAPTPSYSSGSATPVSWTDVVNASTIGNSLIKAGGCGGCPDAGAISAQSIASGDGYVEFTVPESGSLRFIGLSSGNGGTDPGEIKFALRLQGGNAEVRESGAYRTETGFSANDTLRIAYVGGVVQYSKNGSVFYTSGNGPAYPAIVDTTLFDDNATVWNVMIGNGGSAAAPASSGGAPGASTPPAPAQASGPVGVNWTSDANVAVNGNSLIKTGGCGGCPDAGAISAQQISSGDGYVEFSGEGSGLRFIGLSSGNNGTDPSEIKFAVRLQGGTAEVRESGAYRSETGFSGGDTLRVAIVGGNVEYSKNGSVFYTSSARPSYPMLVDTSLFDGNAAISNVMISGAN